MTVHRSYLLPAAVALTLASCAQPAREAPVKKTQATAPDPAVKPKPVRMNGRGKLTSISLTEFFPMQQSGSVLIYDARPGFFYGLGHIPGAINMPKEGCDAQIVKRESEIKAALAAKKTIVVYCTNLLCPDARAVANHLAGYGYSSSILTGGWETWKDSGMPTE
ncbi:MAG: rhodanese-like domain-containing protein [Verrucomicrobiota bacterium]